METVENKYITVAYKLYTMEDGEKELFEEAKARGCAWTKLSAQDERELLKDINTKRKINRILNSAQKKDEKINSLVSKLLQEKWDLLDYYRKLWVEDIKNK